MTGRPAVHPRGAVVLLLALAACAGRHQERVSAAVPCEPVEGPLPAGVSTAPMAGAFRLMMVATAGDSAGRVAEGRLDLRANDTALVAVRYPGLGDFPDITSPYYGSADVALGSVGAFRPEGIDSTDPLAPGVLVLDRRPTDGAPRITVRFGALANRRDAGPLFDGGYTALRVSWIADTAFGGTWESAVPDRLRSGGHFCAYRMP